MKNKTFLVILLIGVAWFFLLVIQNLSHLQLSKKRLDHIRFIRDNIAKIKRSINKNIDESVSKKDLLNITEIIELEGRITELHIDDAVDESKTYIYTIPASDFFLLILLVALSMKIGVIDKKYRMNSP